MSDMKFWRPGKSGPEETVMLDSGSGDKITNFNPNGNMSLDQQRRKLPIFQYRNHILWLIENLVQLKSNLTGYFRYKYLLNDCNIM